MRYHIDIRARKKRFIMKSVKEISTETKIQNRLKNHPVCLELVNYLFADAELQEMQEYANNMQRTGRRI